MATTFAPIVYAMEAALPSEPPDLEYVTEAEVLQGWDPDLVETYVSLTHLESAEAREVVATILAGDPGFAGMKEEEAEIVLLGLGEFLRGGARG